MSLKHLGFADFSHHQRLEFLRTIHVRGKKECNSFLANFLSMALFNVGHYTARKTFEKQADFIVIK